MKGYNNPFLAIQYHLYEYPLYTYCSHSEDSLNILIIGFREYGQRFLDACLQNGQMRNKKLNVTVISDDKADKEAYLSERPELSHFFDFDGSLSGNDDNYGSISFEICRIERNDQSATIDALQSIMCEQYDLKRPHYVFVALGNDVLNRAAADACRTAVEVFEMSCIISYICEESVTATEQIPYLYPLFINADIERLPSYSDIERMAFNTHLVWEKNLNVDYGSVRAGFRKEYNHNSCISSVLSLKYKLYSIGIDLETNGFIGAAKKFGEVLSDRSNRGLKNELIWIEHRRWVTEKLCLGWRRIANLEDCAMGITKDEKRKRHVCIVRSRPDQKLATEYRSNDDYEKWDKASNTDLSQLDELDRMSVELHRIYAQKAKMAKKQNLLYGNNIAAIRTLIEGNRRALVTFQEWFTCLKDIWNEDMGKVHQYKSLKSAFLNASDGLPTERRKAVREQIKAFEAVYYPVLASMEYRDWKQDDVALIDNIPFILTYTESAYLAVPFATGDNTAVFGNVAASTVVSPSRILYLYYVEKRQSLNELSESIPYVIEYMRKKNFKAVVEFILLYPDAVASFVTEEYEKSIVQLGNGRIRQVKRIAIKEIEAVHESLTAYLNHRRAGKTLFAVEKNATTLSYMLQGSGFYKLFPYYQFDSCSMKFHDISNCEMLGFIKKTPYITVADMAAFRLSSSESSNHPEFYSDYKDLWKKYQEKSVAWKALCETLRVYSEKNDVLASFKRKAPKDKESEPQKYTYILPFTCNESVAKILHFLKNQEIIEQGSRVSSYTTDSCEVVIIDRCGYRSEHDKLFSNVYALMLPDFISVHLNTKSREANVAFDDLVVNGVLVTGGKASEINSLMEYFRDRGYVINLYAVDGKLSFTYSTRRIKELLTTAGKMLEVYTYHKVKELGKFDDVVSSFEIDWEETDVKSEFDCILTKGFRTLFVECKARLDIEQNFYYKIAELKDQFGINATAVLVADTQEKPFYTSAPVNAMQRRRGNMMDVVTIWRPDEINNIGHTLLKIINGTYASEEDK